MEWLDGEKLMELIKIKIKEPNFLLKMVMQEVPSHNDYEEKSDTRVEAEEENVEEGKHCLLNNKI